MFFSSDLLRIKIREGRMLSKQGKIVTKNGNFLTFDMKTEQVNDKRGHLIGQRHKEKSS